MLVSERNARIMCIMKSVVFMNGNEYGCIFSTGPGGQTSLSFSKQTVIWLNGWTIALPCDCLHSRTTWHMDNIYTCLLVKLCLFASSHAASIHRKKNLLPFVAVPSFRHSFTNIRISNTKRVISVSYTHLDVYKRQHVHRLTLSSTPFSWDSFNKPTLAQIVLFGKYLYNGCW